MSAEEIIVMLPQIVKRKAPPKVTLEEWKAMDAASERPLEYCYGIVTPKDGYETTEEGEIRAMSGGTPLHNRIAGNVFARLHGAFEERDCEVYMDDIKTRVSPGHFRYPDVVAVCGPSQFDNDTPPALLNPMVIVEVLSPSTQAIDRGIKAEEYRSLPTVTDYILVAQDRVGVTHYARKSETHWTITDYTALDDALTLASLDVTLTVAAIYRKITLPPSAPPN